MIGIERKKYLIMAMVFNSLFSYSQNQVLNYSFEEYNHCPNLPGQISLATYWFQPDISGSSSDYHHQCDTNFVSVPNNFVDFQYTRTGMAYAGIGLYSGNFNNSREYIEGTLKTPLIAGQHYCVEFYVSHTVSAWGTHSIDAIGAYFSNDSLFYDNYNADKVLPYQPQVENKKGNVITDTLNWVLISGKFIAQGGERFITIGNFQVDSNTVADSYGTPGYAYYYIDDVSVTLCDSKDSSISAFSLYPSISDGSITVTSPTQKQANANLIITDILGQRVAAYPLQPGNNSISLPELAAAMYLYQIVVDEVVVKKDKMVVVK